METKTGRAALELFVRGLAEGDKARVEKAPLTVERGLAHKRVKIYEIHDANVTVETNGLLTNIPASYLYPIRGRGTLEKIKQWLGLYTA